MGKNYQGVRITSPIVSKHCDLSFPSAMNNNTHHLHILQVVVKVLEIMTSIFSDKGAVFSQNTILTQSW